MPPPRPKFWFRVKRKSDGKCYSVACHDWKELGSKIQPSRITRYLRAIKKTYGLDDVEVTRFELVVHAPRKAIDLLKQLEESEEKGWPIW